MFSNKRYDWFNEFKHLIFSYYDMKKNGALMRERLANKVELCVFYTVRFRISAATRIELAAELLF